MPVQTEKGAKMCHFRSKCHGFSGELTHIHAWTVSYLDMLAGITNDEISHTLLV